MEIKINIGMRLNEFTDPAQSGPFNIKRMRGGDDLDWIVKTLMTRSPATVKMFINNQPLYRGIRIKHDAFDYGEFRSLEKREPTSSSAGLQINIDTCLEIEEFQALRSNSAFCTGSLDLATEFGSPFLMFPFDPFTYTWSTSFVDLYNDIRAADEKQLDLHLEANVRQAAKWFVDTFGFRSDNFKLAVSSGHEILVKGQYALVNLDRKWDLLEALQNYRPGK